MPSKIWAICTTVAYPWGSLSFEIIGYLHGHWFSGLHSYPQYQKSIWNQESKTNFASWPRKVHGIWLQVTKCSSPLPFLTSTSPVHMPQVVRRPVSSSFFKLPNCPLVIFILFIIISNNTTISTSVTYIYFKKKEKNLFPLKMSTMIIKPKAPLKLAPKYPEPLMSHAIYQSWFLDRRLISSLP